MRHVAILGLIMAMGGPAHADSIELYGGGSGATSSWEGDSALMSMGKLGWRFDDRVGVHLISHAGYAGVNHRMILAVGAGGQLWTTAGSKARPYIRGAVLRTAEQPFMNLADDPVGAMLGTADNVVNRFGLEAGAGIDVTLVRARKFEVFGTADVGFMMFDDDVEGPETYTTLGLGLGVRFDLGKNVTPLKL
jgi:hypothetical protein